MDDPVAIALVGRPEGVLGLVDNPPAAVRHKHGIWTEGIPFPLLNLLTDGHRGALTFL